MPIELILALIVFSIPVAIIYLLIANAHLKKRVKLIEEKLIPEKAPDSISTPRAQKTQRVLDAPSEPRTEPSILTKASKSHTSAQVLVEEQDIPRRFVFNFDVFSRLITFMIANWFYAISALSLALSGIFLVIYGMEQGLLPPEARVLIGFLFGAVLIATGEYLRRRFGDADEDHTAYLPSVFSGAGIVTLYAAVLSARILYDFISPDTALLAMAAIGCVALVLGWFYGPVLAAIGVIGAMTSPFIIGGLSEDASGLLGYFAGIVLVGLGIDTIRRWAWLSALSLILGFAAGTVLFISGGIVQPGYFIFFCLSLVFASIIIPARQLVPAHSGTLLSIAILARSHFTSWPEFPTRVAGGSLITASLLILFTVWISLTAVTFWIAILSLSGMVLALLIWARNAPALIDITIFPAFSLIAVIAIGGPVWLRVAERARLPEADFPIMPSALVVIGVLLSIAAAWRSLCNEPSKLFVALGATVLAPFVAIAIELFWQPVDPIGTYVWGLHAMAIAAIMALLAKWFANVDGPASRERVSFALLSAVACIAFGLIIMLSSTALTLAIAVTVGFAAWLDRQFNLLVMGLYIASGVTVISYRLVADPGLLWAINAPLFDMIMAYLGSIVAFVAAYCFAKSAERPKLMLLLESAIFSTAGLFLSLLLFRFIQEFSEQAATKSHWAYGIGATIWFVLGIVQIYRLAIFESLLKIRVALGAVFFLLGFGAIFTGAVIVNPLQLYNDSLVLGLKFINTLIPAYLLPAAILIFAAWRLPALSQEVRKVFWVIAMSLAALWLGLEIRHFWRGAEGMRLPGMEQAELYSYTVALLITGTVLFYQSLVRQKAGFRRAGLLIIGLAVAKVFFFDIQGLAGLIRVFSLLCLGLVLAGLAWLNRWAILRAKPEKSS